MEINKKLIDIEIDLLKSMSSRSNFDTYYEAVDLKKVYPSTKLILEDYEKYFKLYEHTAIDFQAFFTQFNNTWHNDMDTDDVEYYRKYVFPAIAKSDAIQAETSLLGLIQQKTLEEINKSALKEFDIDKITAILDIFREKQSQILLEDNDEACFTIENIDFSTLDKSKGIPYFLPVLQESLDSLVKGQFVVVTADTGGGKSAFSIAQASQAFRFLRETKSERPILYFNSEGTEADVYGRFLSNLFKEEFPGGFEQIFQEIDKVKEMLVSKYNPQNFKVFQLEGKTVGFVKAKMMKYNPSLVIVDIADTLVPEESPTTLKKLYDTLRQMSGTHCPIIGTTQAGDMAYMNKETGKMETKKWLTTKDVYGAKQKAGAADTIIGIGVEPDSDIRYLNVAKLKRGIPVKLTLELRGIYSDFGEVKW